MNPEIIEDQIVSPNSNRKKLLWLACAIFLLITTVFVGSKTDLFRLPTQQSLQQSSSSAITTPANNRQTIISRITPQTFTSSQTKNVVTYVKLAIAASDQKQSYDLYKKAFLNMGQAYEQTKNIKYKYVMIDLKTYLSTFPQYNSKELIIPQ